MFLCLMSVNKTGRPNVPKNTSSSKVSTSLNKTGKNIDNLAKGYGQHIYVLPAVLGFQVLSKLLPPVTLNTLKPSKKPIATSRKS